MISISGGGFLAGGTGLAVLLAELERGEALAHLGDWHLAQQHLEQRAEEPSPCMSPSMRDHAAGQGGASQPVNPCRWANTKKKWAPSHCTRSACPGDGTGALVGSEECCPAAAGRGGAPVLKWGVCMV